jgi:hypothetical protein
MHSARRLTLFHLQLTVPTLMLKATSAVPCRAISLEVFPLDKPIAIYIRQVGTNAQIPVNCLLLS